MNENKLDPKNESHWMTHAEWQERETKLARIKVAKLTQQGAPKPDPMSPLWNDWAANNPQGEALALSNVNICESMMNSLKGIIRGARPIEKD